jgi:hypothetical protein
MSDTPYFLENTESEDVTDSPNCLSQAFETDIFLSDRPRITTSNPISNQKQNHQSETQSNDQNECNELQLTLYGFYSDGSI